MRLFSSLSSAVFFCLFIVNQSLATDVKSVYQKNCAECHNAHRLGGMGPALLPENLKRLRKKAAVDVINNGRVATQMPAFAKKLNKEDIQALVDYIYTPSEQNIVWGLPEINTSHIIHNLEAGLPDKPVFKVDDLLNLFLVVELGDHHVTLLDGDKSAKLGVLFEFFAATLPFIMEHVHFIH